MASDERAERAKRADQTKGVSPAISRLTSGRKSRLRRGLNIEAAPIRSEANVSGPEVTSRRGMVVCLVPTCDERTRRKNPLTGVGALIYGAGFRRGICNA